MSKMKLLIVFLMTFMLAHSKASGIALDVNESEVSESEPYDNYGNYLHDPCSDMKCEAGFECELAEDGNPTCACEKKCPPEPTDYKLQICTTQNVTFESECEFYRERCLCLMDDPLCDRNRYLNAHLDYYGPCKELPVCREEELADFPMRMRTWLLLIMEELDSRNDLSEEAHLLVQETKTKERPWVLPVIWKFCDLDQSKDRSVTSDELLWIKAALKPLEHCTATFLERCDSDANGHIHLKEWGICLGLDEGEIEDRCDALRN